MSTLPSLQRMLPRHFKILEMVLAGHDTRTIAQALDMSTQSVSLAMRSPVFQSELAKARQKNQEVEIATLDRQAHLAKAQSILEQATEKAATTLVNLLDEGDPSVRLRGADKILERALGPKAGGGPSVVVNISAEQVNLLQQALLESTSYAKQKHVQPADPSDADTALTGRSELQQVGLGAEGSADQDDAETA